MDFAKGYKLISGLLLLLGGFSLEEFIPENEAVSIIGNIVQTIGLILAIYGGIMKIVRRFKESN